MNLNRLKRYARSARRQFIDSVVASAAEYGLTADGAAPEVWQGDIVLVSGRALPQPIATLRRKLVRRMERKGFERAIEEAAYTWFNRFAAIRYMEVHGLLSHGLRVLSNQNGGGGLLKS